MRNETKARLAFAVVALVTGGICVAAGVAAGKKPPPTSGPALMQSFAGPSTVVAAGDLATLLEESFGEVRHVSVTVPAGALGTCGDVWSEVNADMNGDGFPESHPAPLVDGGCHMSVYQFDAWGFRVIAHNDQLIPWQTEANATVTFY